MTDQQPDELPEDNRARRAQLTNMRQELLAPVTAIVGYGEILHDAVKRIGLDDMIGDLDRILGAARDLHAMVDRLLDADAAKTLFDGADSAAMQQKLRHDLRTPINAIKGYGEMLVEDLEDFGGETLRADFTTLLAETDRLLAQLDGIVDFSSADGAKPAAAESSGAAMFSELVKSIRPVSESSPRPVETGHILVVDDIETNRDLLSRRLTSDGHRTAMASGGRQALAMLAADRFDLVLLDLMMPDMNGFEVLQQMKSDGGLRDIPVIVISALDEMDSVVRCIEAGAEDYLPKPFDPVLLKARINAGLEKKRWHDRERDYLDRLESEKEKYERLLLNILPREIVGRLNSGEAIIADRFDVATVLFADLVGFTELSADMTPSQLVSSLNHLFSEFDALATELGVEKIKMIGDAYMVVAGVPNPRDDHAPAMARMGLGMLDVLDRVNQSFDRPWMMRVGIHSGPVVAGIIGTHRFLYDVWGETVNLASRLESFGLANRVQISGATARLLGDDYEIESRGTVNLKGIGRTETYLLNAAKVQIAEVPSDAVI